MTEPHYDAVIIGAGAGGGTAAWALVKKGFKVLILEAGPRYNPQTDYKANTNQWEQGFPYKTGSLGKYSYADMQSLSENYSDLRSWNHITGRLNPNQKRISYGYHHVRGVGGSSLHFTGEAHRLNPLSMKMKTQFGVAADWPLSYKDLEPYYVQAENIVGVAGPIDDIYRPRSEPYPEIAHHFSYSSKLLNQTFKKNGLNLVQNSLAVLSQPRIERLNCNYCGSCLKGCPRSDKGSIDVTYIREAEANPSCEIKTGCFVSRIETTHDNKIKGVHYIDNEGEHFIETPKLILAAGAIETPRLLLASSDIRSPHGLANESEQVGKNFMETLLWTSSALHPEPLGSHRGLPVDSICWDYNAPDAIPDVIGGCRFSPSVGESDLLGPINYAQRVVKGWGKSHKQAMRKSFGHVLSLTGIAESLPNSSSYIDLDPEQRDSNHQPIARIHSHIDEMAVERIQFMAKMCRKLLIDSGAKDIFEEFSSYDIFSSTHVFGTARMGENPEDSVVDPWCKSHRWENMYIVDASIFPSSGGGESPGLTIQALALRAMSKLHL
jgi:choline dehydrogenase-like flavoprotein